MPFLLLCVLDVSQCSLDALVGYQCSLVVLVGCSLARQHPVFFCCPATSAWGLQHTATAAHKAALFKFKRLSASGLPQYLQIYTNLLSFLRN